MGTSVTYFYYEVYAVTRWSCSLRTYRKLSKTRAVIFYRAMHFSAKRGIAIACRLSVHLSVCLSVRL